MLYALVTGSSKGIGLSISEGLLRKGYFVFLNYLSSEEDVKIMSDRFNNLYKDHFLFIKADLSEFKGADEIFNKIKQTTSNIDLVVFNAGLTDRTPFPDIPIESWMKIQNLFVNVPVYLLQKLFPIMRDGGNVLFVGSLLGNFPHSLSLAYGVAKSAVHSLVKNLVKFFSERKIRVNGVAPGFIDTEWQLTKTKEIRKNIEEKIALGHFGKPENISDLMFHLIENDYINGTVIRVDGGYSYR
jgi:3-oxoacyl-[acyl-carrier protein] reductase